MMQSYVIVPAVCSVTVLLPPAAINAVSKLLAAVAVWDVQHRSRGHTTRNAEVAATSLLQHWATLEPHWVRQTRFIYAIEP